MVFSCQQAKKENTDNKETKTEKKYQAKAPPTQSFGAEAFKKIGQYNFKMVRNGRFFY
jgi:hypothetical protein